MEWWSAKVFVRGGGGDPKRPKNTSSSALPGGATVTIHQEGNGSIHAGVDGNVEEVLSSQPNIDQQMEAELREKMVPRKQAVEENQLEKRLNHLSELNRKRIIDVTMVDREDENVDKEVEQADSDGSEDMGGNESCDLGIKGEDIDAETYARHLGYVTQAIKEMNEGVMYENSRNGLADSNNMGAFQEVESKKEAMVDGKKQAKGTRTSGRT